MSADPSTRDFLEFKQKGSPGALARVFDRLAPELMLLASQLAPEGATAEDLLQNTFLVAIESRDRFEEGRRVAPWLVGILLKLCKQERRQSQRTPPPVEPGDPTTPADEAMQRETAEAIAAGLEQLAQPYREVLHLRLLHGLEPLQIARAKGVSVETVKTQLKRGKAQLRGLLPKGLIPTAVVPLLATLASSSRGLAAVRTEVLRAVPVTTAAAPLTLFGGVLAMKKLLTGCAVALAAIAAVYALVPSAPEGAGTSPAPLAEELTAAASAQTGAEEKGLVPVAKREALAADDRTPVDGSSRLTLRAQWDDGTPATGIHLRISRAGNPLAPKVWTPVDGSGELDLQLDPGRYFVYLDRGSVGELSPITLESGEAREEVLRVSGITVEGRVVDQEGRPIPGADVGFGTLVETGLRVMRTAGDGSFRLRGIEPGKLLFARAEGFQRGRGVQVTGEPGETVPVVLEIGDPATSLRVIATMPDGRPAAEAYVVLGMAALTNTIRDKDDPPTISGHADDLGVFVNRYVSPTGPRSLRDTETNRSPHRLWVKAEGAALWGGNVQLDAERENVVRVQLQRGGVVRGRVLDDEGVPLSGVGVRTEQRALTRELGVSPSMMAVYWVSSDAETDAEGNFELSGIYPGEVRLTAGHRDHGQLAETVRVADGEVVTEDLELEMYYWVSGRLTDDRGQPLIGWNVWARTESNVVSSTRSVEGGAFRIRLLTPEDRLIQVPEQTLRREMLVERPGVAVGTDDLELEVPVDAMANSWLVGTLTDWDGSAGTEGLSFYARRLDAKGGRPGDASVEGDSGAFRLGPFPAGTYRVDVRRRDRGSLELGVHTLEAGQELQLGALQWSPPGRIRFSAVDALGAPLQNARLVVRRRNTEGPIDPFSQPRIEGGHAVSNALQPGAYEVHCPDPGKWLFAQVEITAGRDTDVVFRVPPVVSRNLQHPAMPHRTTPWTEVWRNLEGRVTYRRAGVRNNLQILTRATLVPIGTFDVEVISGDSRASKRLVINAEEDSDQLLVMPSPF